MHPETERIIGEIQAGLAEERNAVEPPELALPEMPDGEDHWLPSTGDIEAAYDLKEQAYQDKARGVKRRAGDVSNMYLKPGQKTVMGIDVATGQRALNRGNFNNPDAASNYVEGVRRLRGSTLNVQDGYDMEGVAGAAHIASGVLAEGGSEADFNRAMDRMNMPKWQGRIAWNAASQQKQTNEIADALSEPYTDEEEKGLPAEVEADLSRDELMRDEGWQTAAKQLWQAEQGEEFDGPPSELMSYFVDEFTNFNWKMTHVPGVGSSSMAYYASRAMTQGQEYAQNFLTLMDYYDRLKTDSALFADALTDVFADPTTYVGLGGGAIGMRVASRIAQNRLRKGLAEYVASGVGAGIVEGAVYGAVDETQRQRVEKGAGEREELNGKQIAMAGGVGGTAGALLGGGLGVALSPEAMQFYRRSASQVLRNARTPRSMTPLVKQTGSVGATDEPKPPQRRRKRKK